MKVSSSPEIETFATIRFANAPKKTLKFRFDSIFINKFITTSYTHPFIGCDYYAIFKNSIVSVPLISFHFLL